MSILDWLRPRSKPSGSLLAPAAAAPEARQNSPAGRLPLAATDLKARRQERRERLYSVVREAMLRSEVLASRYKFKVLSLDTHGRQFLIMIDLMDASVVTPERFASIEQLIIAQAAHQHGIYVKSVYWRGTDSVLPPSDVAPQEAPRPVVAAAVPMAPTVTAVPVVPTPPVKPVVAPSQPVAKPAHKPPFDPIDQAEVLAFKKAIGAIPSTPAAKTPGQMHTSGSRRAMTGFEDTQILDTTDEGASPLSRTQFGELL